MPVSAECQRELRRMRTERRIADWQAAGYAARANAVARKSRAGRKAIRSRSVAASRANHARAGTSKRSGGSASAMAASGSTRRNAWWNQRIPAITLPIAFGPLRPPRSQ